MLGTFLPRLIIRNNRAGPDELRPDTDVVDVGAIRSLWLSELTIITRAGDRHSRNYYAWDYGRRLFHLLSRRISLQSATGSTLLATEVIEQVQQWCLQHPRDISGWAFLAFLLLRIPLQGKEESMQEVRMRIVAETEDWVRKFAWEGESVEWFWRVMGRDAGR